MCLGGVCPFSDFMIRTDYFSHEITYCASFRDDTIKKEMGFEEHRYGVKNLIARRGVLRGLALGIPISLLTTSSQSERLRRSSIQCGTTEIQNSIPPEESAFLEAMDTGQATILEDQAVRQNPRLSRVSEVNALIESSDPRMRTEMVIAVTRRLADTNLEPTLENVREAIHDIHAARERFRNIPIFNETVIFASGAVTENPNSSQSVYKRRRITRRLGSLEGVERILYFDGLLQQRQGCDWATTTSLEQARDRALTAFEQTETYVTGTFRMHGNRDFLEFGTLFPNEQRTERKQITLKAEQIAEAIARRHARRHNQRAAERFDFIVFDDCKVYTLVAETLVPRLAEISHRRGEPIPLPVMITASEDDQLTFRGTLMERLLFEDSLLERFVAGNINRAPTLGVLYPNGDQIGRGKNSSNAVVIVPDEKNRPLQIA